jgi:Kdo2-lipid IVA lauroyltransferase/acyltransferase
LSSADPGWGHHATDAAGALSDGPLAPPAGPFHPTLAVLGTMACMLGLAALLALLAMAALWLLTPWRLVRAGGALVGAAAGSVLRIRRREVEDRLRAAGFADEHRVASDMYASLGAGLLELLWISAPGRRDLRGKVRLSARAEELLASLALPPGGLAPSGAVVATAHVGNWDLAACAVAERAPLFVVSKRLSIRWLDATWQRLRARRGVRLLPVEGAVKGSLSALGRGALVAMIIDQAPERPRGALKLPFLGHDAWHDLAPATVAARSGKPLVLALGKRLADGTHLVDTPLCLHPPPRADRAWIEAATGEMVSALEAFIRENPAQWLWLHRRWKPLPVAASRAVW